MKTNFTVTCLQTNSSERPEKNIKMLEQAFPGYKAQVQPREMANFIYDFSQSGGKVFNVKIIPISLLDT